MTRITEKQTLADYNVGMKRARTRPLLDLPADTTLDVAMIATCCAVAVAALIYLVAI